MLYNPELFKIYGNTHKERLLNLCTLVAEDDATALSLLCLLPTSADAALIKGASSPNIQKKKNEDILEGHYYATLREQGGSPTFFLLKITLDLI